MLRLGTKEYTRRISSPVIYLSKATIKEHLAVNE